MASHSPEVIKEVLTLRKDGMSYRKIGAAMAMSVNQVLGICYREHLRIQREGGTALAVTETGMEVADRELRPSLPFIPGLVDTKKYTMRRAS